ncbi:MFS transporter [Nonomuraea sp. NPDC049695]|uniref:MFS transporter n=1 Tax=Nonomuraea sp. NPDC049695 TaxID=3154734 RepID=UPI003419B1F1
MILKNRLAVLRVPNFRRFFAAQSASIVGDEIVVTALAFAVLALSDSPAALGLVLAARTVPMIVFMLIGGVLGDLLPRNAVMMTSDLVRFASQAVMSFLLVGGVAEIWQLVLLQAVHGLASAAFAPAIAGMVRDTVEPQRLQEANALLSLLKSTAKIAGPVLGGLFVLVTGPGWAIAADAVTFLVSALFLWRIRLPAMRSHFRVENVWSDVAAGWKGFWAVSWVWSIVCVLSVVNMLQAAFNILGPIISHDALGGSVAWGIILSAFGGGSVVGGLVSMVWRPRFPLRTAVLCLVLFPLPVLALGAFPSTAVVAASAVVSGIGLMVFNTLWDTSLQTGVDATMLSRVSSYEWAGSMGLRSLGLGLVGWLAASQGAGTVALASGLGQLLLIGALFLSAQIRTMPSTQPVPTK